VASDKQWSQGRATSSRNESKKVDALVASLKSTVVEQGKLVGDLKGKVNAVKKVADKALSNGNHSRPLGVPMETGGRLVSGGGGGVGRKLHGAMAESAVGTGGGLVSEGEGGVGRKLNGAMEVLVVQGAGVEPGKQMELGSANFVVTDHKE